MPEYQNAGRVGIYLSMPKGEICTGAIVRDAFAHHKQVFVPYLYKAPVKDQEKPQSVMDMVSLHSSNDWECLNRDAWGIPTVAKSSVVGRQRILGDDESDNKTKKLDMIIMPGVAFDSGLSRLGHGKGFYDYFLQRYHTSNGGSMPLLGT
jgi:5-formyltetrahydrofolate cyclo-ligase